MKKFYIVVLIFAGILLLPQNSGLLGLASGYDVGEYSFYIQGEYKKCDYLFETPNGDGKILTCPVYLAESVKRGIKGEIKGESFRISGGVDKVNDIISCLGARVVKTSTVDGIYCVYLYSGKLGESVELGGERVNGQIAVSKGKITIGCPIILGSY